MTNTNQLTCDATPEQLLAFRLRLAETTQDIPLKLKPTWSWLLLADSEFKAVKTIDLIHQAQQRIKGISVSNRSMAIAILKGAY